MTHASETPAPLALPRVTRIPIEIAPPPGPTWYSAGDVIGWPVTVDVRPMVDAVIEQAMVCDSAGPLSLSVWVFDGDIGPQTDNAAPVLSDNDLSRLIVRVGLDYAVSTDGLGDLTVFDMSVPLGTTGPRLTFLLTATHHGHAPWGHGEKPLTLAFVTVSE